MPSGRPAGGAPDKLARVRREWRYPVLLALRFAGYYLPVLLTPLKTAGEPNYYKRQACFRRSCSALRYKRLRMIQRRYEASIQTAVAQITTKDGRWPMMNFCTAIAKI